MELKRFITDNRAQICYLVGAGISLAPPSGIPVAASFIEGLLQFLFPEEYLSSLKALSKMRFEELISIFQKCFNNLGVIDYFTLFTKPNKNHQFLGEEIKDGKIVFTTNFDELIEKELETLDATYNLIIQSGQQIECSDGTLLKLHGSRSNYISKEDTTDSIIATLEAIGGTNKDDSTSFQVEDWKQQLFFHLVNEKWLIVLGYSGSDDFDISPMLKKTTNMRGILWINHAGDKEPPSILEFYDLDHPTTDKVHLLLQEIAECQPDLQIYYLECDTEKIIDILCPMAEVAENDDTENEIPPFLSWLQEKCVEPSEKTKALNAIELLYSFHDYENAEKIITASLSLELVGKELSKLHNMLGVIKLENDVNEARTYFEIAEKELSPTPEEDVYEKVSIKMNKAQLHESEENYELSIKETQECLALLRKLKDTLYSPKDVRKIDSTLLTCLINLSSYTMYLKTADRKQDLTRAKDYLKEALKIANYLQDKRRKIIIAFYLCMFEKNSSDLIGCFDVVSHDAFAIGDMETYIDCLIQIGKMMFRVNNTVVALKALNIAKLYCSKYGNGKKTIYIDNLLKEI